MQTPAPNPVTLTPWYVRATAARDSLVKPERIAGFIEGQPRGIILHSTRSDTDNTIEQEFNGTVNWAHGNVQRNPITREIWYLGWTVTIGKLVYARHMPVNAFGWHAAGWSSLYIGMEFAQAKRGQRIHEDQITAACAYLWNEVRPRYPDLFYAIKDAKTYPRLRQLMPEHWETPPGRDYGKTDVDSNNPGALAMRIVGKLNT